MAGVSLNSRPPNSYWILPSLASLPRTGFYTTRLRHSWGSLVILFPTLCQKGNVGKSVLGCFIRLHPVLRVGHPRDLVKYSWRACEPSRRSGQNGSRSCVILPGYFVFPPLRTNNSSARQGYWALAVGALWSLPSPWRLIRPSQLLLPLTTTTSLYH